MKKKKLTIREIFIDMITNHSGSVSSKIVIGTVSYLSLVTAIVILMFINPSFPGLTELVSVLIITSSSLLGLTTVENIKQKKNYGRTKNQIMYRGCNR